MLENFELARENMVEGQIRTADVTQPELIAAFREVPREIFAPESLRSLAYIDAHLPVAPGRYLTAPAPLARLLQLLELDTSSLVLDIGCATGYSSAVVSRLAGFVVAVEENGELAKAATENLSRLEYVNVMVVEAPLTSGHAEEGPFDAIFLGGAIEFLPDDLLAQLKPGGRLVAVEGSGNSALARLWVNEDGVISSWPAFNCALPPLPGFRREPAFTF